MSSSGYESTDDPLDYTNPWYEKAEAVTQVEALAYDEDYNEFLKSNAVRSRTRWEQSAEPVEILIGKLDVGSEQDIHRLLTKSERLIIDSMDITLTKAAEAIKMIGSFHTDAGHYLFYNDEGRLLLEHVESENKIEVSTQQITRFLGIMLQSLSYRRTEAELSRTAARIERADTPSDELETVLTCLGSYDGESSNTTWGLVRDYETDEEIVMRLTEIESPRDSAIDNKIEAYVPTELFADEVGLELSARHDPKWSDLYDNAACSGLSRAVNANQFAKDAFERPDIFNREGFSYYRPDEQSERHDYAALCARFVKIYGKLRSKDKAKAA